MSLRADVLSVRYSQAVPSVWPPSLELRMASLADLPELLRIENAAFRVNRISPRQMRYLLRSPSVSTRVIADVTGLHGYIMCFLPRAKAVARVYSLAVDEAQRRSGLGGVLLASALESTQLAGYRELRLEVRVKDEACVKFYRHHGFVELCELSDYYEDHADALRMRRVL